MAGEPEYYAVAVVKIRDNSSELIYLKRKNSCHTGSYTCQLLFIRKRLSSSFWSRITGIFPYSLGQSECKFF